MTKEEKPSVKTKLDAMCELLELEERNKMLKDEMKNRISMALKDPILQQGFELICKENAELKKQLNKHPCVRKDYYCSDCLKDIEKAKELLKEAQGYIENIDDELYDEIEQFLNSEVDKINIG